jgi:hypothetical protein
VKTVLNVHAPDSDAVATGGGVTNKALTSNVATLTTAADHGLTTGDRVVVAGVDATFDGTYAVASTPSTTTFTYAKTHANVTSVAATGTVSRVPTYVRLGTSAGRRGQRITMQNKGPGIVSYDFSPPAGFAELASTGVSLAVNATIEIHFDGNLYLTTDTDSTDFRYVLAG